MAITIKNSAFLNGRVGISAPAGTSISIERSSFEGLDEAISLRDPPYIVDKLGLSRDIDLTAVKAMLTDLATRNASADDICKELRSGRMAGWLAVGADIVQVAQGIAQAITIPAFMHAVSHWFG